eukprot:CAMPEP_0195523656 /NCGR_PEP_ID=MMETSP0794_2-20130614/22988_1 /TAXON_ID=515487 /ORGANISM="Stephanopyxis turris, Strain CCMP 815" /LENGTH=134 /DNA_ID=CAMNT_0040653701 /DNA_START=230 /DNA_END=634 /DNA_ORIENTATION=+
MQVLSRNMLRCTVKFNNAATTVQGSTRMFSTQGFSAESESVVTKLKSAFKKYRMENYSQCTPTRFKKEMVSAMDKNQDGSVSVDDIDRILVNIGASHQFSRDELESVLYEMKTEGRDQRDMTKSISIDKVLQLI